MKIVWTVDSSDLVLIWDVSHDAWNRMNNIYFAALNGVNFLCHTIYWPMFLLGRYW